ncbi:MAG: hypothetical protein U0P81_10665 [Holophagaceae bacterium]
MAWLFPLNRPTRALLAALGLAVLAGCSGKKSDNSGSGSTAGTITVTAKVTYTRIPLATDAAGVPTGLDPSVANRKTLPARGIQVVLWEGKDETAPDGTKSRVWLAVQSFGADETGTVAFKGVTKDADHFVEVVSSLPVLGNAIRIIGDPAGINSNLSISDRVVYSLRKGLDGSAPAGNPTPATRAPSDATVTFDVGLDDKWWLGVPSSSQLANASLEPTGTGSRVLAILDTAYGFSASGLGTPSPGRTLDLHYRRGVSEARGSFVEYDRSRYPLALTADPQGGTSIHYFGSIKGGSSNDDAFDEGVLLPLFARNSLWGAGAYNAFPIGKTLPDLLPEMAILEAMPYVMAASILKSPYLADTTAASTLNTDVRALGTTASGATSGPALAGLAWEIVLKANSLPSPGTATDWAKINPQATARYFTITTPGDATDRPNVFLQLARLKDLKSASEPVDLAAIFPDSVLTPLAATFNIPWPRPTSGAGAATVTDWGADPNSNAGALAPFGFSMAKATQVDGAFPNTSSAEAFYTRFTLSKDTAYQLRLGSLSAALPPGARLEVRVPTNSVPYVFTGASDPGYRVVLRGNKDTPLVYLLLVRLVSPDVQVPDFTATLSLEAQP